MTVNGGYLYDKGLGSINALADANADGQLLTGYLRVASHLPQPQQRLATAIRRARMVRDQVILERATEGPLQVPAADVEIDFDVEWHPADGYVYQWGARVRQGQDETTATYDNTVLSFETLDDAKAQALADRFFDWLEGFVADHETAGRTVRIFHWTSPELTKTIRVLGGDRADALFERFLDLRRWMDDEFFARDGLSLKTVAPVFNFKWRADDAGGETSVRKIEDARNATNTESANAARVWLEKYNEDDCKAQAVIRDGLRANAAMRQISDRQPAASPVGVDPESKDETWTTTSATPLRVPISVHNPQTRSPNIKSAKIQEEPKTEPRKPRMPAAKALSLNEIKTRVDTFVAEWQGETSEKRGITVLLERLLQLLRHQPSSCCLLREVGNKSVHWQQRSYRRVLAQRPHR